MIQYPGVVDGDQIFALAFNPIVINVKTALSCMNGN